MKRSYKATKRTGNRTTTLVEYGVPHAVFAQDNQQFKDACAKAGVQPTRRQAAKWRQARGRAYAAR